MKPRLQAASKRNWQSLVACQITMEMLDSTAHPLNMHYEALCVKVAHARQLVTAAVSRLFMPSYVHSPFRVCPWQPLVT